MQPTRLRSPVSAFTLGGELEKNHRILVVDDNEAIHDDFRKILCANAAEAEFDAQEAALFGDVETRPPPVDFALSFASQGAQALEVVKAACLAGQRFGLVFLDVRMPPGWDGLETAERLWEADPDLQIVICTAYSDKSWEEMMEKVANSERVLILKKPFDAIEVLQMAHAITEKWSLLQASRRNLEELERTVSMRTRELRAANVLLESEVGSHKATGAALRRSEQELADFFENASVGLLQLGADGKILRVNKAEIALLGYERAEYLGHHVAEFHVDPGVVAYFLQRLLAGETVHDFEARLRCKDGTIKHVLMDANALWENGKFVHARCFTRDNTARKLAEDHVREQAALLDKAQEAIFVHDLAGRVLYWNRGAERLYGWSVEHALGQEMQARLCREAEKVAEARRVLLAAGDWSGEFTHWTASERELIVESRWTLVRDEQGVAKSVLVINTDVTEKRQLQAKFLRAQRLESIGTLAGGIAHDLNNILQPISLAMDLFRLQLTDPASREMLDLVSANAQRATSLVKQVLSFARGVEGERTAIRPAALVEEVASIVRETFPKAIVLRLAVAADAWPLLGDSTQLHQVLLNLCVNARDAMPEGGTLSLAVENVEIDEHYAAMQADAVAGRYVVFSVADTGAGIPDALREKIFDPFFTTKEQGKGTGLGLATTLSIVRSHGGFIALSSKEHRGTAFRVFFPASETASEPAAPAASDTADLRGNGELILMADDEATILNVLSKALERFGYRVLLATDGADGVRLFAQHRREIRAVITDMMMPIMDGPAMIAALKQIDPAVKVIATTGMSSQVSLETIARLGVKQVLSKPCPVKSILAALREVLDEPVKAPL